MLVSIYNIELTLLLLYYIQLLVHKVINKLFLLSINFKFI